MAKKLAFLSKFVPYSGKNKCSNCLYSVEIAEKTGPQSELQENQE